MPPVPENAQNLLTSFLHSILNIFICLFDGWISIYSIFPEHGLILTVNYCSSFRLWTLDLGISKLLFCQHPNQYLNQTSTSTKTSRAAQTWRPGDPGPGTRTRGPKDTGCKEKRRLWGVIQITQFWGWLRRCVALRGEAKRNAIGHIP